jgi:hypothetical protein
VVTLIGVELLPIPEVISFLMMGMGGKAGEYIRFKASKYATVFTRYTGTNGR